ncbi:MAG: hydroxymethylbilane synthase, partial [Legionellales bacterium]
MSQTPIQIATRKSPLALWQANHIKEQLERLWPNKTFALVPMVTSGDTFLKDKLIEIGGKGLFVKELEEALLSHRADIAVHSTKDMPAELPEGLILAAICKRDNPFDALVSAQYQSLDDLPLNARIGTASLRRQSQLLAYRPDLIIKSLRGNINTRIAKLEKGEYEALILAAAGLERMGLGSSIKEIISEDLMLPSCGQGALCIESRANDPDITQLIAGLHDSQTSLCVQAERRVNAQLGGNCHTPLAVYCKILPNNALFLRARIGALDGSRFIEDSQ